MEASLVCSIAHSHHEAKVTVVGVPNRPGTAAAVFKAVANADINVDVIIQSVSACDKGLCDISFTVAHGDGAEVMRALTESRLSIGFVNLVFCGTVGKLSLVGAGLNSDPSVTASFFRALAHENINIQIISISGSKISALVAVDRLDDAVQAAHVAFDLD
ncbi:ACT domain-containing protein [Kocuria marina]|uniref:ACT domain-containing protein n=1 Tax=Kocuria marina TaxID=223184 RepID=UPI00119D2D43|nr:ACT domain-containing protein [Kocuria indica]